MSTITFTQGFGDSVAVAPPTSRLSVVTGYTAPAAAPVGADPDYRQAYSSPEASSRIGHALPQGSWKVAWSAGLHAEFDPSFVLAAGEHVLVEAGQWTLLDRQGRKVAEDQLGHSRMVLDAARGQFFYLTPDSVFVASRLTDGARHFAFSVIQGGSSTWPLLAQSGRRVLMAGSERKRDPHRRVTPRRSSVQVYDLGDPISVDASGISRSVTDVGQLTFDRLDLQVAATTDAIVVAEPNRIVIADWNLKVLGAFSDDFTPVALSLDEAARIHMVVETTRGRQLWLTSKDGARLFTVDLAADSGAVIMPPIVSYDRHVYLVGSRGVVSFDGRGRRTWSHAGAVVGAAVTADRHLLVSEGKEVAAFDPKGRRRTLVSFPETLLTPPVLNQFGDLFVASQSHAYCAQLQPTVPKA